MEEVQVKEAPIVDVSPVAETDRIARYVRYLVSDISEHLDELCRFEIPKARQETTALVQRLAAAEQRVAVAEGIMRDVAKTPEHLIGEQMEHSLTWRCKYCGGTKQEGSWRHFPSCVWMRARTALAAPK